MQTSIYKTVLSAMLTALSVALGYLLIAIPNVELITVSVFMAGILVGPFYGFWIGFTAEMLFSTFNPYGMPIVTVMCVQVAMFAFIGWLGGIMGKRGVFKNRYIWLFSGMAGMIVTVFYGLLTDLSFALTMSAMDLKKIMSILGGGFIFNLIHIVWNTMIFAFVVPLVSLLRPHMPGYLQ